MRIVAIGDVHGCCHALRTLIGAIRPQGNDVVIPLGDVVDRGPDARGVIDLLLELRGQCRLQPLLGNHEETMLAVLDGGDPGRWIRYGGAATLDSYGFTGSLDVVPQEHVDFLQSFQLFAEEETHFFVHANYHADLALTQQSRRHTLWISLEEHLPPPHVSGKVAVVGHTANRSGQVVSLPHLKCIDTYCYGGGWLTALEVASGQIWQANQAGDLRTARIAATSPQPCAA